MRVDANCDQYSTREICGPIFYSAACMIQSHYFADSDDDKDDLCVKVCGGSWVDDSAVLIMSP